MLSFVAGYYYQHYNHRQQIKDCGQVIQNLSPVIIQQMEKFYNTQQLTDEQVFLYVAAKMYICVEGG